MTKIAIASCCKIRYAKSQKFQPVWSAIEAEEPDLVLLLGDNVYMRQSGPRWDLKSLEKVYQAQLKEKHFASLVKKVPVMATWDDHDFGPNDSRGASKKDKPFRAKSRKIFHKYWQQVKAINTNRPKVYCSYELGDVKVIMLDVRYYRTDLRSRRKATVLGKKQEAWLKKELNHDKKFTIVGSGTCLTTGGKRDKWSAYEFAYKRLRKQLEAVPRLLFVSGDIHRNKFVSHKGFYEVISSGVGRMEKKKPLENYGLIDFGNSSVKIELRGRRQRDIKKRIRVSNWKVT